MKKSIWLSLGLVFLVVTNAQAATRSEQLGKEFLLNQASPQAMADTQLGTSLVRGAVQVLKLVYDYSKDGGAVGTIGLRDENHNLVKIPKGAIISGCLIDQITTPTSGGSATIALNTGLGTAGDIKDATAYGSFTGLVACVPVGSAASSIRTTIDTSPSMAIATAALTAGKINVLLYYFLSDLRN